ncbi:hypothetical protein MNBD_PLANCTO02-1003 [hydrothermal vent metagenome]|uniref:Phospholipase/carboxylesterase/thioesterase domain-containing protein n=1 Tax=hydrothermal vent metagenome TaxID=652676 RepID=A0A3B1DY56_9ZZZZ
MKEPHYSQQFWLNRGMITDQEVDSHSPIDELFQNKDETQEKEETEPFVQNGSGIFDGIHWQTGSASSLHAAQKPLSLYLPERYESNYEYPLIVWLHSDYSDEEELFDIIPQISDQNFMAIGFRGNVETQEGCKWGNSEIERALFFSELHDTLKEFRREFHIHPKRIYLAGLGTGATMALQGMLHYPDWFAGAIAINSLFSNVESPLARFRSLNEQRTLLIETTASEQSFDNSNATLKAGRLLHSAGIDATSEIYKTSEEIDPQVLLRVNHWIMQAIATSW